MLRREQTTHSTGSPLHFTQMGLKSVFSYIMIDLTGASRFKETDGSVSYLYGMIAVCMVSKLTHVDQLICLDDMADVRDLLEHARRTASLAGVDPLPPGLHPAYPEHDGHPTAVVYNYQ